MGTNRDVIEALCTSYDNLSKTDQKIAAFILDNRNNVPHMAMREIAQQCGISSPTISRFIKRLGYADFNDLRLNLARSSNGGAATPSLVGKSTGTISLDRFQESLHYILTCKTAELADTVAQIDEKTIVHLVENLKNAGTIVVTGVGNTKTLADNMAFKLRHIGLPGISFSSASDAIAFIPTMTKEDILVIISSSGISRRLNVLTKLATELSVPIALITSNPESPLIGTANYLVMSTQRDRLFAYGVPFSHNSVNFIIEILFLFIHASSKEAREHVLRYSNVQGQIDRNLNMSTGEFVPIEK